MGAHEVSHREGCVRNCGLCLALGNERRYERRRVAVSYLRGEAPRRQMYSIAIQTQYVYCAFARSCIWSYVLREVLLWGVGEYDLQEIDASRN